MCNNKNNGDSDDVRIAKERMGKAAGEQSGGFWDTLSGAKQRPRRRPGHRDGGWFAVLTTVMLLCNNDRDPETGKRGPWSLMLLLLFVLGCGSNDNGPSDDDIIRQRAEGNGGKKKRNPDYKPAKRYKPGQLWFSSQGMQIFRHVGLVSWFRYVFIDTSHHDADCRWAKFINNMKIHRVGSVS